MFKQIRLMQNARCFILIGGQSRDCTVTNDPVKMHRYCSIGETLGIPGFYDAKRTNETSVYNKQSL